VRLDAVRDGAGQGVIREVCGTINYLQPGRSSLISRGLFSMQHVAAAGLRRNDPAAHVRQINNGCVQAHRPAVISVNMLASSLAVNELLARLHPYREEPNANFASVTFSLSSMEFITEPEGEICNVFKRKVGTGDLSPLLGMPELSTRKRRMTRFWRFCAELRSKSILSIEPVRALVVRPYRTEIIDGQLPDILKEEASLSLSTAFIVHVDPTTRSRSCHPRWCGTSCKWYGALS
jgi:hypothetical protein